MKFLLEFINLNEMNAKKVVSVDDFSVAGSLNSVKNYWNKLTAIGPKYGYFPKPAKSCRFREKNFLMEVQNLLANSRVNTTAEGKRHLGAVIRSTEYRDKYVQDLVKDWDTQLTILSTIAEKQPQAAYLAFASRLKSKLNYYLRTIILQELNYLPCTLPYKFIFSSETDYITLGESEETGAIFWVIVGQPEIAWKLPRRGKKVAKCISREPMFAETWLTPQNDCKT